MPIEESTVLHAIAHLVAPKIDPKLRDSVYSYRLAKDWQKRAKKAESLFSQSDVKKIPFLKRKTLRQFSIDEPWYSAWPEFDAASTDAVKKKGFTHLTKTDITAYFENIELRILESTLRRYLPETAIIEILIRILDYWTRRTPSGVPIGRGIPQGNDVSSFLGNIYLIPLDEELERFSRRKEAVWFRYVDDVKVFTKSYEDAREAVFLINRVLRQLHLNLQGSKTDILFGGRLLKELFDPNLEAINDLITRLDAHKKTFSAKQITKLIKEATVVTKRFTRGLPESVTNLTGDQSRLFRRCLTLLGTARRPQLRNAALDALRHLPDVRVLRSSLRYLGKLNQKYHDDTATKLLDLLRKGELPFPYQMATAVDAIKYLSPKNPRRLASDLRKFGFQKQRDWYVRQKTIEAILVLPYRERYVERLALEALKDENPWVRRAAAALVVRGRVEWVRQEVGSLVYHIDPDVARVGLYWRRHLDDLQAANQALAALFTRDRNDYTFIRRVPMTYLLRCHGDQSVGKRLFDYVEEFGKSRNAVVRWHCGLIRRQLSNWVDAP